MVRTIAIAAVLLAAPAGAAVTPLDWTWPVVAKDNDGDCRLEVTGNGKFFLISATGLGARGTAGYHITNGDMIPIDWRVTAGEDGRFARYYIPFRFGHQGDRVNVTVTSESCSVSAAFDWKRTIRVID